jgi:hypothetical protein
MERPACDRCRSLTSDAGFLTAIIGMSTDLGFMSFFFWDDPAKSSVAGCLCSTLYE